MTKIRMNWATHTLEMTGHANSGPPGQDLVCCAESILSQTLITSLQVMATCGEVLLEWEGNQEHGTLWIHAETKDKERQKEMTHYFRFALNGLNMLMDQYPEYIEVREVCNNGNT